MWDSVIALVPTVVATGAFFVVLRLILRADRMERRALTRLEAQYADATGSDSLLVEAPQAGEIKS